jgi:hypothetical protein
MGLFDPPRHWGLPGSDRSELLSRRDAACAFLGCLLRARHCFSKVSIRRHRHLPEENTYNFRKFEQKKAEKMVEWGGGGVWVGWEICFLKGKKAYLVRHVAIYREVYQLRQLQYRTY